MTTQEIVVNFKEIRDLFKETDRKFQETDRKFQETDRKFQETDRKFQETDRKFQETERLIKESSKETDRMIQKLSQEISQLKKTVSDLTSKWGKFVEGLLIPAVKPLFMEWGISIGSVSQHVKGYRNGNNIEIDVMAISSEYAIVIEAKSTLKKRDVNDHLSRLNDFKSLFPEYQNKKVMGAVAGIVIEENVDRYAFKKGLFILTQSGKLVTILNNKPFEPKTW